MQIKYSQFVRQIEPSLRNKTARDFFPPIDLNSLRHGAIHSCAIVHQEKQPLIA